MSHISDSTTSGIYIITCLPTGKIYVGSSINIRERWRGHKKELRSGKHKNRYLQNAWNKYGEQAFVFEVLEVCSRNSLLEREQYWLDTRQSYKRNIGFNIGMVAGAAMRGRKLSREHRAKIGAASKGNQYNLGRKQPPEERAMRSRVANRHFSPEHKANISAAKMGHTFSHETIIKMRESHSKRTYIVTTPEGVELEVRSLRHFCKERGLTNVCMYRIIAGKQAQHKGWKCRLVETETP